MRVVKHMGARSCPADEAKVLLAVPIFPGEHINRVQLSCYFASGDASAIDQPGECNWYGIGIPWGLVFATQMMDAGGSPSPMSSIANYDSLYKQWLHNVEEGTGEMWGGDTDLDKEDSSDEEGHSDEELINSGPIGVHEWFSREVLMEPLAAEGNTVIRFGDRFNASRGRIPAPGMGALYLFGMVRFVTTAQTELNVELDDTTSREVMGLLIAGDYTKIMAKVESDASAKGDYARTVLFGGDNYVEADTLKGPAGKAVVKAQFSIDSPMSRQRKI